MIWVGSLSIHGFSEYYIVTLKCYQTAIQYLDNVTLPLVHVGTPRNDKKLTRLGFDFVLWKVSALIGF